MHRVQIKELTGYKSNSDFFVSQTLNEVLLPPHLSLEVCRSLQKRSTFALWMHKQNRFKVIVIIYCVFGCLPHFACTWSLWSIIFPTHCCTQLALCSLGPCMGPAQSVPLLVPVTIREGYWEVHGRVFLQVWDRCPRYQSLCSLMHCSCSVNIRVWKLLCVV